MADTFTLLTDRPANPPHQTMDAGWHQRGKWPAQWIEHPALRRDVSQVLGFRRSFSLDQATTLQFYVSADQAYELYLDGQRIHRGPERGDENHWKYHTLTVELQPGQHQLFARVVWMSLKEAAFAVHTSRPAFLLHCDDVEMKLHTGEPGWQVRQLPGYQFVSPEQAWGVGYRTIVDARSFDPDANMGGGDDADWHQAQPFAQAVTANFSGSNMTRLWLEAATLPDMFEAPFAQGQARHVEDLGDADPRELRIDPANHLADEADAWTALLQGRAGASVTVPANTRRRVILDLDEYVCAYTQLTVAGGQGATIRTLYAESLFEDAKGWGKGNRDVIEGKLFRGAGGGFVAGGQSDGITMTSLDWDAGRFIEVLVETADEPVTLSDLQLTQTHYPYEWGQQFAASDNRLTAIVPIMQRGMEMCSHWHYMDCPHYERLMYVGDTRLEVLVTYAATGDDRLPRKAIDAFNWSRFAEGFTQSRYPCRNGQIIPPFSVWWTMMVHDFALWRGDKEAVRHWQPGVRSVLEAFLELTNDDGLVQCPSQWNFFDWVDGWGGGEPADAAGGVSALLNWQLVLALRAAAQTEDWLDEPELATRFRRLADNLAAAADKAFWNEGRGLYADDQAHTAWSEHAQCLALLAGVDKPRRDRLAATLFEADDLARCTIYFIHYLFEVCQMLDRPDVLLERLEIWHAHIPQGMRTPLEKPEPSRSDCHAWAAHPLFHYSATLIGVRPTTLGGDRFTITPQFGPLTTLTARTATKHGWIEATLERDDETLTGQIKLPEHLTATLHWNGQTHQLKPGENAITL